MEFCLVFQVSCFFWYTYLRQVTFAVSDWLSLIQQCCHLFLPLNPHLVPPRHRSFWECQSPGRRRGTGRGWSSRRGERWTRRRSACSCSCSSGTAQTSRQCCIQTWLISRVQNFLLAFNNKNIETVPAVHDVVLDVEGMLVVVHVTVHRHLHQEEANVRRDNLGQSCYHPRIQRNHLLGKRKNNPGHE